jgi:hypothetical protein
MMVVQELAACYFAWGTVALGEGVACGGRRCVTGTLGLRVGDAVALLGRWGCV